MHYLEVLVKKSTIGQIRDNHNFGRLYTVVFFFVYIWVVVFVIFLQPPALTEGTWSFWFPHQNNQDDSPLYVFDSSFCEKDNKKRLRHDYKV